MTDALSITIQGISFPISPRYAEGHKCTPSEAATLNQALGENLRNNFSKTVKADLEAGMSEADIQAKFAQYATDYQFHGYRRGGRPQADPTIKEAKKLARLKITEQCRLKGIDPKSFQNGKMEELVDQLLTKDPFYKAEAKRRMDATKQVALESIGSLLE